MKIDELLDELDDMLDKSWSLPLSGGRCVLDADKVREIIDDLRLNLPKEIPQAKAIVADRMEIIKNAKSEANDIIEKAEKKAQMMIAEDEIVRQAQEKAAAILKDAQTKAKDMKKAAADFADNILIKTEDVMAQSMGDIKAARQALKAPTKLSKPGDNAEK
jgi:vacuolar-type H+-ATPase subunit H